VEQGCITACSAGSAVITCLVGGESCHVQVEVKPSLATLSLPGMLRTVEAEAFLGNAAVQKITLGGKVQQIDSRAFAGMAALQQLQVDAALNDMAANALEGSTHAVLVCPAYSWAHWYASRHALPYVLCE